jgi:hypothetical protein
MIARLIRWEDVATDGCLRGRLAGDDQAVMLRYVPDQEPGSASLQVRVPCPEDPGCPGPAWDIITDRADLLLALDGGRVDDPVCEICHQVLSD